MRRLVARALQRPEKLVRYALVHVAVVVFVFVSLLSCLAPTPASEGR